MDRERFFMRLEPSKSALETPHGGFTETICRYSLFLSTIGAQFATKSLSAGQQNRLLFYFLVGEYFGVCAFRLMLSFSLICLSSFFTTWIFIPCGQNRTQIRTQSRRKLLSTSFHKTCPCVCPKCQYPSSLDSLDKNS